MNTVNTDMNSEIPHWDAYVDLNAAVDSVDDETVWLLRHRIVLPSGVVDVMMKVYALIIV